ncbi:MAG: sigma-54 dependent transcriptional regulator [Bacteroidales bacterium]|nr:sigma-54 dependent transcriptional regulator [Bacteroidales bacterium]
MILVIDDDISIRESLRFVLGRAGHEVMLAEHPKEALDMLRQATPDVVLMDMNFGNTTSGREGLELLRKVKVLYPSLPVILITAWGTIPLAVEGMRLDAADFVTKPWNNLDLLRRIDTTLKLQEKPTEQDLTAPFQKIIGSHPTLLSVLKTAQKVAPTEAPVLILGENGTGKELLAEAIHLASKRTGKPFIKVNLGGISQTLFESEMFGHKKGAFTGAISDRIGRFELADKGTIFLDEIGDLDPASQVKLLRVLQEHTFEPLGDSRSRRVDIRVICATNADLAQMVREKSFREDLYYRINLITVKLPALRERATDIPALIQHFSGEEYRRFSPEALAQISALPFPGNIRELKNLVERLLITHPDGEILASAIADDSFLNGSHESHQSPDLAERDQISAALERSAGNIARAAAMLGLSRQALYRRMDKYGLR